MYRVVRGKISTLSTGDVSPALLSQAPDGPRRAAWLAGRVLLSRLFSPLPEVIYSEHGKPLFAGQSEWWFNLSHSGDDIALLLSDEGEVGCDVEAIRPRANWQALANAVFSNAEHAELERTPAAQQLAVFWHIWTRKEAIVKQRGGSAWQIVSVDSHGLMQASLSHCQVDNLSLAVCTATPFTLHAADIQFVE